MRIAVAGGGPAGLYFALLMKRDWPTLDVTVIERNRADDTFGFGVVFSDQTLDTFQAADQPSYEAIRSNFAYWDDIEIHFKGTTHRVGGNGFCGCSRRTLLTLLQDRARKLGVSLVFQQEAADPAMLSREYDLVVAADGINSSIRETYRDHFVPETDLRPNRFVWMGSTKPLDAFTFHFRELPEGIVIIHAYQYEPGRSTWIFETDPDTYAKLGFDRMSEAESADFLEKTFAEELGGHKLITNRSLWRQFPMIRCSRWVKDNIVLMGDAKSTAHFSIGSGTKLAMEDAIHLHRSFHARGLDVSAALEHYETTRREEVEKTQHAADVSLVWFEHVERFWDFSATRFAFGLMTRSKAITYDNLALRAPEFVAENDRLLAEELGAEARMLPDGRPAVPMFQPFRLRDLTLENRVVLSPMCMYSAENGVPNDFHLMHYGSRAVGGAGLIFTEMTCTAPDARITPGCTGLWNDEQEAAWRRIVDLVHGQSTAKICLQIGHAGRKGATKLMWEGMDRPLAEGAWPIVSASPIPYYPQSPDSARSDACGHGSDPRRLRRHGRARRPCRFRHDRDARGPRLPAGIVPLSAYQPALGRIRRQRREPDALPARGLPRHARGMAARKADVRAHFRHGLGRGRHHPGGFRRDRPRLRGRGLRPRRRLDRPDHDALAPGLWPHVPDALL